MDPSLIYVIDLARRTGQLLLKFFYGAGLETRLKADKSIVTEADIAADELIASSLGSAYPDDLLLSEELAPSFDGATGKAVWIIDPLDGTTNFSLGLHFWGVSIARVVDGGPQVAALYFPLIDEFYTAQRGGGCFLNGKRLAVRPPNKDRPAAFFSCCSRTYRRYQVSVPYKARILGSASYSLCAVARGIAVLSFESTPKIWDIAGGSLLVEEAGGIVAPFDGRAPFPLIPGTDYGNLILPTLAAASPELMEKAKTQIIPKAQ